MSGKAVHLHRFGQGFQISIVSLLVSLFLAGPTVAAGRPISGKSKSAPNPEAAFGRHIELKDYYRFETATSPVISPDGRFVAYTRTLIDEPHNVHESQIWLAMTDGSFPPRRISQFWERVCSLPRWSADSKMLGYITRVSENGGFDNEFSFFWMDGTRKNNIRIQGVAGPPIFSPDNKWIAFTKRTLPHPKAAKTYASDFDRLVNERFHGREYDWMDYRFDQRGYLPDPRDPMASPPEELYIVPREGGEAKQITALGVDVRNPVWSPDSKSLAFAANSHERDEYIYDRADLWVVRS